MVLTRGIPRLHELSFTACKSSTCFCCKFNLAQTLHHMYCDQCHHCRNIAAFSASRYCKLVGSGYKDIWSPVFPTSNKPDSGQLLLLLSFRQNLTEDLRNNEVVPYGRGANDHNRDLGIKSFPKSSQVNVSLLHENCSLPKNERPVGWLWGVSHVTEVWRKMRLRWEKNSGKQIIRWHGLWLDNTENFTLDHIGAGSIKKSNIIIVAVAVSHKIYTTEN